MLVLYLVCIHKEEDEQNQLCQQNYQQDNEELEGKIIIKKKETTSHAKNYYKIVMLVSCIRKWWSLWTSRLNTHTQQQELVLLDGAHPAQEACHHDDGAQDDDQIGGWEWGEGGRECGKAPLRHGEPDPYSQQTTSWQLEREGGGRTDLLLFHNSNSMLHGK